MNPIVQASIYKVSVQRVDSPEIFSTTNQGISNVVRYMNTNFHAVDFLEDGNALELILTDHPVIYRAYPLYSLVK